MKKLVNGIIDFRYNALADYREKFSKLALGQSPDSLFIACCDSRVVPNTFASSDPGDLFVVRNIGNLVPPYVNDDTTPGMDLSTAAAIEFSLVKLNISDIIICGHSECAAMQSFFNTDSPTAQPCVSHWLEYAKPSFERYQQQASPQHYLTPQNHLSQINTLQQIEHLKTYPWVKQRLELQRLRLHAWWFDLATADVYYYDDINKEFVIIDADQAEKIFASL